MTNRVIRALGCATAFAALSSAPAAAQRIDNIVVFGDSYSDTGNAVALILGNPGTPQSTKDQIATLYPTGRFSGGTNYIDTLAGELDATIENYAIGGALTGTGNTNTGLPGLTQQVQIFLSGAATPPFPTSDTNFEEGDLLAISIGGNDARVYQQSNSSATTAQAAAAAAGAVTTASANLNALVAAGAPTISFLAGDTGRLPEIATNPTGAAIRSAYSAAFNAGMQATLAGYAANGVMVHYLDLNAVLDNALANPAAYGIGNGLVCPIFPDPTCVISRGEGYLFYGDALHLTPQGFRIVGQYVAAQLQAPLTLQATSDMALDTARQFGRTLTSRLDLSAPRDGGSLDGLHLFAVGDSFSRDVDAGPANDPFDIDSVGATIGLAYGMGTSVVGLAGNYSRPRAQFLGDIGETESTSWQIGAFAGYTLAGLFAQAYLGYGWDDHEIERGGVVESLAADTDGSHWLAGAKLGYLVPLGIFRAGPVASIDYARARVDDYVESGDEALNLAVDKITARSLVGGIGAEVRGDFAPGGIALRPVFSAMVEAELSGDDRIVRFAQTSAPGIVNEWRLDRRSKDPYGRLGVGGSAEILGSMTLSALGSATLGKDDGDEVSAHVALRLGL